MTVRGGTVTVMVKDLPAVEPALSVAVTVKVKAPAAVTVPSKAPVFAKVVPGG